MGTGAAGASDLGGQGTLVQEQGDHRGAQRIIQRDHSDERLHDLQPAVVWGKSGFAWLSEGSLIQIHKKQHRAEGRSINQGFY